MICRSRPHTIPPGSTCRSFGPWFIISQRDDSSRSLRDLARTLSRSELIFRSYECPWTACIRLARHYGMTIASAESCTGGGVAARLTSVPGASRVFLGGVIAYHNRIKAELLAVSQDSLVQYGAVSEACALEMASGARSLLGASLSISVTGIAGPGGATPDKPLGTVCFGLATEGTRASEHHQFSGTREEIRHQAAEMACAILINTICQRSKDAALFGPAI